MNQNCKGKKVLIGALAIQAYLDISEPTFYKFVKLGLPAVVIDNRWYAHTDNIDAYFQKVTFARTNEIPPDAE